MNTKDYIQNATRTEAVITEIKFDAMTLHALLHTHTILSRVLDMAKKNIFYGKPIDTDALDGALELTVSGCNFIAGLVSKRAAAEAGDDEAAKLLIGCEKIFCENLPRAKLANIDTRLLHATIGFATESSEMLEAILNQFSGEELDRVNMAEEIGDLEWYKAIALDALGADEAVIRERNIAKLKARFPGKFSADRAINRDVAAERVILEGEAG